MGEAYHALLRPRSEDQNPLQLLEQNQRGAPQASEQVQLSVTPKQTMPTGMVPHGPVMVPCGGHGDSATPHCQAPTAQPQGAGAWPPPGSQEQVTATSQGAPQAGGSGGQTSSGVGTPQA